MKLLGVCYLAELMVLALLEPAMVMQYMLVVGVSFLGVILKIEIDLLSL